MPTDDFSGLIGPEKFDPPEDPAFPPVSYATSGTWHAGLPRKTFLVLGGKQYQANAGACTMHGYPRVVEAWARRTGADFQVCRQDGYFGARYLEGNGAEKRDGGAYPSLVRRWFAEYGTVDESRKPYDANQVTTWRPPASWAADRALLSMRFDPLPLNADAVLFEVGSNQGAVAICHRVTDSINHVTADGIERFVDGPTLGGHCRAVVGYDLDMFGGQGGALIANSWRGWGAPHPLFGTDSRFDDEPDSFSWMPLTSLADPKFIQNFDRLAVPPNIKP